MMRSDRLNAFKYEPDRFTVLIRDLSVSLPRMGVYDQERIDQESARPFDIGDCTCIALLTHLEREHPFGAVRPIAEKATDLAIEYFYGDWREGYDDYDRILTREQCRKKLQWIDPYREGLMWALCLDMDEQLLRLAEWLQLDLKADEGFHELTEQDKRYHIVLARFLRGASLKKSSRLISSIRAGTRRRPKMLVDALEAIAADDADEFVKVLTKYLKYYQKIEFDRNVPSCWISIEGTILWHVARRSDLTLPELPMDLADLIVTQETIGLIESETSG